MVYSIGQLFVGYGKDGYLLAQVDSYKVGLICLSDGNRWADPVEVFDPYNITEEELEKIYDGGKFELFVPEEEEEYI